jgi:hypothetical protein
MLNKKLSKLAADRCWKGYEPVPGKKPYSNDSCRPIGSKKKKSEKKAMQGVDIPQNLSGISPATIALNPAVFGMALGGVGGGLYGAGTGGLEGAIRGAGQGIVQGGAMGLGSHVGKTLGSHLGPVGGTVGSIGGILGGNLLANALFNQTNRTKELQDKHRLRKLEEREATFNDEDAAYLDELKNFVNSTKNASLWANIRAKKQRGEAPAKPGSEDYPDAKNWKKVTSISEKKASPAWQTSEGKSESGGLNDKGRASLKAQGHDIKRPQPEGGPRKDSFCARMQGMKSKLTSSETANDPDSRINKSLRKWKCGSAAAKLASLLPMPTGFKFPAMPTGFKLPSMPQPKPESWKSQAAGWGGQRAGKQYGAQLGSMAGGMANTLGKPLGVTPGQANQFGQAVGNFASPILGNIGSFVGSNAQRYNIPIPGMPSILR